MSSFRVHCIDQVPFERAAAIGEWAVERGHLVTGTRAYANETYPSQSEFDMLVVLGGPMGVHDTGNLPWLLEEKRFLRDCLDSGKLVIGLCLGAQLLAEALGGSVRKNHTKEIGWHKVQLSLAAEGHPWFCRFPQNFYAFQWHGDTFSIPPGATHLAKSDACLNQAFAFGEQALGLQFHLEYTEQSIRDIMKACPEEMAQPGSCIRPAADMLAHPNRVQECNALLYMLLDRVAAGRT